MSGPDNHSEHHLHDGPGLCLPLSLRLAPAHPSHQAGGGVAPGQPRLSLPHNHHKHHLSRKTFIIEILTWDFYFVL